MTEESKMTSNNNIIIYVQTNHFYSHIHCITPQFANFLKYMDGELDSEILLNAQNLDLDKLKQYFTKTYGTNSRLVALIFYKYLPSLNIQQLFRKCFENVSLLLLTNDIHQPQWEPICIDQVDGIIGFTTKIVFDAFYPDLRLSDKLLHAGNRCPDEFLQETPNFETDEDAVFFYGRDYANRKRFFKTATQDWRLVTFPRVKNNGYNWDCTHMSKQTAKELYKYRYAFTTGNCVTKNPKHPYYLVAKFFEIMGSGCLLLCDTTGVKSQLEELGFFEKQHYLHIDNKTSATVRRYVMENPVEIQAIRKRAHALVKQKYTIKTACEGINEKLAMLAERKK